MCWRAASARSKRSAWSATRAGPAKSRACARRRSASPTATSRVAPSLLFACFFTGRTGRRGVGARFRQAPIAIASSLRLRPPPGCPIVGRAGAAKGKADGMSDRELGYLSASELLDAYRRKTLSPVEATRAALSRIERLDRRLNAFCLVDAEGALAAARQSEARWAKGAPMGLLDGVPATVKDLFLTRGWPTLRGSKLVKRDQPWEEDAPAVARLREHGAVLLGKTTTPEFGWK